MEKQAESFNVERELLKAQSNILAKLAKMAQIQITMIETIEKQESDKRKIAVAYHELKEKLKKYEEKEKK